MVRVTIIGTGDEAHALAHSFQINNCQWSGNTLEVTKPEIERKGGIFHSTGVPIGSFEDSVRNADVIILAIPARILKSFVSEHFSALKDKIVVDTTKSSNRGEDLDTLLAVTNVRYVKAFHDINAVDLLLSHPFDKTKVVSTMCSRYPDALAVVKSFAENSLGFDIKSIPYEAYSQITLRQESFGEEWLKALRVMSVVFILAEVYAVVRYNVFAGYAWYHMPIQVTNKAIAWASITGFALAQLPGVLAHLWNTVVYDSLYTKPSWLQSSLANRKQVGLLSLWLLTVHVIMSTILFNPAYYGKLFADPEASSSQMNSVGEVSLFFAILAVSLYFVRGICMLPSAGIQMTSKQLRLINGSMAWVGLAFATIHVMVLGVKSWNDQFDWPSGLPPITLLSVAFPLFVVGLKFIQVGHSSIGRHCLSANYYDDCRSQEMTISFDSDDMGRQSCFNVPDHVVNSSAPPCFSDEQIDFSESQHASSSSKEVRRQIEATEEVCGAVFQTQLSVGHLDATRTTV